PAGWMVRGFPAAWLFPVHIGAWHWILAGSSNPFGRLWIDASEKYWRALAGNSGRGGHRIILLPHAKTHGQSLVRGRISRCLGLGRNFFLFGSRQRHGISRAPA